MGVGGAACVRLQADQRRWLLPRPLCPTPWHLTACLSPSRRWNYVWALGYNTLMVPVAAGVLYPLTRMQLPPWVAGACMAFSSVSVVCSSLLLRRYRRPRPVLRDMIIIKQ